MADVSHALQELGYGGWKLKGDPTNADEFASSFKICIAVENNRQVYSDNSADWPEGLTWDAVETKMNELTAAEPMKELRAERDRLIAATDWWASSDLAMTDAQTAYRQALRDITDSASSLDDVTWPTAP